MQGVEAPLNHIIAPVFLARAKIDFIRMEDDTKADMPYKFIGHFIDISKYHTYQVLFGLKDKSVEIVSKKLIKQNI